MSWKISSGLQKRDLENLMLNSNILYFLPSLLYSFLAVSSLSFQKKTFCHTFFFSSENWPFSARPTNHIFTKYKTTLARHIIEYVLFGAENISCEQFAKIFSYCTHLKPPFCMSDRVFWLQQHPLNSEGQMWNLVTRCWRKYWNVHGLAITKLRSKKKSCLPEKYTEMHW